MGAISLGWLVPGREALPPRRCPSWVVLADAPVCCPGDAERGAVTDGVRGELEPEPGTGFSFGGLQRLKTVFVVAAAGGQ